MDNVLISLLLLSVFGLGRGARILGVFHIPSYSHHLVFQPIYKELSLRGHEVVVVTPSPLKDPTLKNLTEIDVSFLYRERENMVRSFMTCTNYQDIMKTGMSLSNNYTEQILNNEEFKNIYRHAENQKFDLVMVEGISSIVSALGHLFDAPCISVLSLEPFLHSYTNLGGIVHPSIYGAMFLDFAYPLTIWQKIQNVYSFLWHKYYMKYVNEPTVDQMIKKYFGDNFPPIAELDKNISMLIVNKNRMMNSIRPLPANIIQVDSLHLNDPKPLPKDLDEILNDSTQGAVYFSLGSNVKSSTLPMSTRNAIIKALSSLPYTVLWKWESDELPEVSDNVIIRKWFPQQDVLAHPNIKAFVTQGGLQSAEEAISRAVPLIGIPAMGDQEDNVDKMVKLGVAIKMSLKELTAGSLRQAITEVVENKKYLQRIIEVRDVNFDQPMTSLERVVWWSEYVIRNKGAPALRSILAEVPLYEYLMLDVLGVVSVGMFVLVLLLKTLLSIFYRVLHKSLSKRKLE